MLIRRLLVALSALMLMSGLAVAKVTIAVGGAGCLCYLPTVLAQQLGEYQKAGVEV
ncbi:MAG: ABC transporter substrate-binding protein, partial [Xanthobacteraceae bacterium]